MSDAPGATAWAVYLLECADGRVYTGIARDPEQRYAKHLAARAPASPAPTRRRNCWVGSGLPAMATRCGWKSRGKNCRATNASPHCKPPPTGRSPLAGDARRQGIGNRESGIAKAMATAPPASGLLQDDVLRRFAAAHRSGDQALVERGQAAAVLHGKRQ
ncbi:GIY-YIG nuclease family protein [Rhodanobacter lindaniclasticus]